MEPVGGLVVWYDSVMSTTGWKSYENTLDDENWYYLL